MDYTVSDVFMQNFILFSLGVNTKRYVYGSYNFDDIDDEEYDEVCMSSLRGLNHRQEDHEILVKYGFIDKEKGFIYGEKI